MPADPISIITAPARMGVRLAVLPVRVLRGAARAVLGGEKDTWQRYAPTTEPSTAGDRVAPGARPKPRRRARPKPRARRAAAAPGPGPEIHVEAPWPDYDGLSLSDLLLRIEQATPAEKAIVVLYERRTANREAVLHQAEKP